MDSCILYQNAEHTITILDTPRSIEEAQGFRSGDEKRINSSEAIEQPFASVEPKSAKALRNAEPISIQSLLLERFLQIALEGVRVAYKGPWCFPRAAEDPSREASCTVKEKKTIALEDIPSHSSPISNGRNSGPSRAFEASRSPELFQHNPDAKTQYLDMDSSPNSRPALIPPHSTFLCGPLETTTQLFTLTAPKFHLVILDPPWPNRSARRSHSYIVARSVRDVASLLEGIPLTAHLTNDALVGVWVTNKAAVRECVLGGDGDGGDDGTYSSLFSAWDLELIEEWVWLKVTSGGEPVCALGSTWRKAYEVLLVGRRRRKQTTTTRRESRESAEVKRRVLISVPDLHSRKPNLKTLFEPMLPPTYEALEVFARNLTAGWWAWGDDVLRFQNADCWI